MAIERPKFYKQKDVLLINDVPVKKEIEEEERFSSASNLSLLTALRTGRVNPFNKVRVEGFTGINSLDMHCTYLDFSYYGEPDIESNFDFKSELRKKKDLKEIQVEGDEEVYLVDKDTETLTHKSIYRATFYKVEHQKDVYISYRLYKELECLLYEIDQVKPKLIIITGKWALFFLTGKVALSKTLGDYKNKKPLGGLATYRASVMTLHECFELPETIVYPMYHTVNAMAMVDKVPIMELDIQKAGHVYKVLKEKGVGHYLVPDKEYVAVADKKVILNYLDEVLAEVSLAPTKVSADIETMFSSIIDCIGLTTKIDNGLCIPFASKDNPLLFSLEDEIEIMVKLRELMLHENCLHVGQNYQYDTTFYYSLWNMDIVAEWDTMVMHHILYNYLPKDLAFLASLYCEHYIYWKGEINATKEDPETRWKYNAKDVCYTLEVQQVLESILAGSEEKLQELYRFQQSRLTPVLNSMMNKGVRIDVAKKEELYRFFHSLLEDIVLKIKEVIGEDFNLNSAPQKKKIFADLLEMEIVKRKGKETNDAAAMLEYLEAYPLYKPFLTLLLEHSSLKVFTNNFLGMALNDDGRARTQYKIAGTATGRLASTKNVWGKGGNLMNVPSKGKLDLVQSVELIDEDDSMLGVLEVEGSIKLPNVKKIFLPDEGKEICDADYSGADIMIVAADSECKWLLDYFDNPRGCGKVYAYIASEFLQKEITQYSKEYKVFKGVFHGTNYLMGINRLAMMASIPLELAKQLQEFYYMLCPEVKLWQEQVIREISTKGYITNIFGRRGWYLNKNDPMLNNKAASFKPQSSIADLMNHAMVAMYEKYPEMDILLQVHDSAVVQYDKEYAELYRKRVIECMEIPLPYKKTLIIPADIQVSYKSYGDVQGLTI